MKLSDEQRSIIESRIKPCPICGKDSVIDEHMISQCTSCGWDDY